MSDPSPTADEAEPDDPGTSAAYATSQAATAAPAELLALIRHAVSNPEAVVGRRVHTYFGDPVTETLESWSARAVAVVTVSRAAADAEIAGLRRELEGASGRPPKHRLLTWDHHAQPDLDGLAEILLDLSGGNIKLHRVEAGGDRHAIVLATGNLDADRLRDIYEDGQV